MAIVSYKLNGIVCLRFDGVIVDDDVDGIVTGRNTRLMNPYFRISVFPYFRISVFPYFRISVFPYFRISVFSLQIRNKYGRIRRVHRSDLCNTLNAFVLRVRARHQDCTSVRGT